MRALLARAVVDFMIGAAVAVVVVVALGWFVLWIVDAV